MKKGLTYRRFLIFCSVLFVFAECIFGVQAQMLTGLKWSRVCFSSILFVCVFFLLFWERSHRYVFTQLALVFTVCADYFLVLQNADNMVLAMFIFSLAQLSYAARIHFDIKSRKGRKIHAAVRAAVSVLAVLVTYAILGDGIDTLSVVSVFYFAHLLVNTVFAFIAPRTGAIFAIGLLLFVFCDTFVGLGMLDVYLPVAEGSLVYHLTNTGLNMPWVFYTPSQTLLGLSLLPDRLKRENSR